MAIYRGLDAYLAVGGFAVGDPNLRATAAWSQGVTTGNIGAATSARGIIVKGDTFTINGESGSPVHTVTNASPVVAAANVFTGVTWTPGIATGGTLINAAITFATSSIANAKLHELSTQLDTLDASVFGSGWKQHVAGQGSWQGRGEAWLDYADLMQKAVIDRILSATPTTVLDGMVFGIIGNAAGVKQFYGSCYVTGCAVSAQVTAMVQIQFTFTGNGVILPNWNP